MKYLIDAFVEVEADNPDEAMEHFLHGNWTGRIDVVGVDEIRPSLIVVGQPKLREVKS